MEEFKIPKLDGENYSAWSIRTRAALVQKNCWKAIDPGYDEEMEEEESRTNEKALTFLLLVVDDQFLHDIAECTRARDAWASLNDIHTKFGLLHTLQLLREFFNIEMKTGESINLYLGRLTDLHRKVSSCGHGFSDREVALVMLMGLPKQYEGLILNLERDEEDLSTKIVRSRLIAEEKKLMRNFESRPEFPGERALKTKDREKVQTPEAYGRPTRVSERKTRCFSCNQWGHIARNCPNKNISRARMASSENHQALCVNTFRSSDVNSWYLDSGATEHMCSVKEKFLNLMPSGSKVEVANSEKIEVLGTGNITLRLKPEFGRSIIHLSNVLYVPKLEGNLLSVGRIEEMGMLVSFEQGKAVIRNTRQGGKIILTAHRCGRLYKIEEEKIYKVCITKQEELLHQRLGHFHMHAIKKLADKSCENDKETLEVNDICPTCILGKMRKTPFPREETQRATRPLGLIHSDVVGPITLQSKGGSRYIVSFIDDHTRYTVVKPMKSKNEVLKRFIEYKTNVENLHGVKIAILRSDNGGEYVSKEFDDYLIKNGISRQLTVPRTPQQNGVAEKMNHTLFDITRCLLLDSEIPNELWADTVTTACYLRNKCPSRAVGGKIPEELWTGKPVQLNHLRRFGCKTFSQIDKSQQNGKLEKRSQECVFIGYIEGIKGYKLWNVKDDKIFVSRNVRFDENTFPFRRCQTNAESERENDLIFRLTDGFTEDNADFPDSIGPVADNLEMIDHGVGPAIEAEEALMNDLEPEVENNNDETQKIRRSNRICKPKSYYGDPVLYKAVNNVLPDKTTTPDPTSIGEAMQAPDAGLWREAVKRELESLHRNQTWELVPRPPDVKPIGCKWVLKKKLSAEGKVMKYKARLVAKGYSQVPGRDFTETFSPVIKIKSLRILIALAVELDMKIHQMDITAAYLNSTLKEDIYMLQPESSQQKGKEHLVCHLKRSLYGLKQSGREWNNCFDAFLKDYGLMRSRHDPCIYFHPDKTLYLGIYVDDMLLIGREGPINAFKNQVKERFEARDLGEADEILSMRIIRQTDGSITLDQAAYVEEMLETFEASSVKGASTPLPSGVKQHKTSDTEWEVIKDIGRQIPYRQAVGSLLYLSCGTRPDIAFGATYMSQFSERPTDIHWRGVRHLFRYIKETKYLSLSTLEKLGNLLRCFLIRTGVQTV